MTTSFPEPNTTLPVYVLEPKEDHGFNVEPLTPERPDGRWLIAFTDSEPRAREALPSTDDAAGFKGLEEDPDYRAFATQLGLPK